MAFAFASARVVNKAMPKKPVTLPGFVNGRRTRRRKPAALPHPPEIITFIPGADAGYGAARARR